MIRKNPANPRSAPTSAHFATTSNAASLTMEWQMGQREHPTSDHNPENTFTVHTDDGQRWAARGPQFGRIGLGLGGG
jgi:hypothetical protein